MGIFFDPRPKAATVALMSRKAHLEAISKLLITDLDSERQSMILGHIARLYELSQASTGRSDFSQRREMQALKSLQELVEENRTNTRNLMILFVSVMLRDDNTRRAA